MSEQIRENGGTRHDTGWHDVSMSGKEGLQTVPDRILRIERLLVAHRELLNVYANKIAAMNEVMAAHESKIKGLILAPKRTHKKKRKMSAAVKRSRYHAKSIRRWLDSQKELKYATASVKAAKLNDAGYKTFRGLKWTSTNLYPVIVGESKYFGGAK